MKMVPPLAITIFKMHPTSNPISSVFCRTFSVNKDEGRYSNYLFILPISSVIGKVQTVYVKKG